MGPTKKQAIKENWGNFFIYLAICAGCVIGHFFIESDWKYALLFVGVVCLWLAFSELIKGYKKIDRSFCPRCGAYIDYDNDVSWHPTSSGHVVGNKVHFTVQFDCCCPDCGYERTLIEDFVRGEYHKDTDTVEEFDPDDWAKDLFWR